MFVLSHVSTMYKNVLKAPRGTSQQAYDLSNAQLAEVCIEPATS